MREIKIPRSIKKKIKEQAKIESGFYGEQKGKKDFSEMTQEEKMKDSQRYARKQRFNNSALGKIITKGKYNKVKVKEGGGLEKDKKIPPIKPELTESGYTYRLFRGTSSPEEGEKTFTVSGKSPKELVDKIQQEKDRLGLKDVGQDSTMDFSEHPEQIHNKQELAAYKQELENSKYQKGSRTQAVRDKKERLKSENKGLSRRDAYRFRKKILMDEERQKESK